MLPINIIELLEHNQDHKTGKISKRLVRCVHVGIKTEDWVIS